MPSPSPARFADLLRAARRRRGLTQEQFARRAGIGVRTLRDLERDRSMPHQATVDLLLAALNVDGEQRAALIEASGRASAGAGPVVRLPPRPALIGRDRDVAALAQAVRHSPLTTLVGVAGVGKTTLAIAVAHEVAEDFPGGTSAISISEVSTEVDVTTSVAAVFDLARAAELPSRMADRITFLIVDGVERAPVPVAAALAKLATVAPSLRILATSRHPVGLAGERVWPVAPLDTPPEGTADIDAFPAVALFKARLEAVRREAVPASDQPALARLVRRLGGLPLALELAAARGRVLEIPEILDRYGDRVLDLSGRQPSEAMPTTLREAVGQSYRLLDPAGQHALRLLASFRHRWSLEMAEPLLTDTSADPVEVLERLVDLGLVQILSAGSMRFRLLDVVRQFAAEKRDEAGEGDSAAAAHARIIEGRVRRIAPDLVGTRFLEAVYQLDEIASDIRAAIEYASRRDVATALSLAAALPRWMRFRGRDREGRELLRRLLDAPAGTGDDPTVRAWASLGASVLALEHGEPLGEVDRAREALAMFERHGDIGGQVAAHAHLVALFHADGAYDLARSHGEAGLSLATRTGRRRDVLVASTNLIWHDIRLGDLEIARTRLTALRQLATELGEHRLASLALANLAEVERLDRRYADAVTIGRRAVGMLEQQGDPRHRRSVLGTIGMALAASGQAEAVEVVAVLRSVPDGAGAAAMIEAYRALHDGDRRAAARWFSAARALLTGQQDVRDLVETMVGQIATLDDPDAAERVRTDLTEICAACAVTLLPRDLALLAAAGTSVDGSGVDSTGEGEDSPGR